MIKTGQKYAWRQLCLLRTSYAVDIGALIHNKYFQTVVFRLFLAWFRAVLRSDSGNIISQCITKSTLVRLISWFVSSLRACRQSQICFLAEGHDIHPSWISSWPEFGKSLKYFLHGLSGTVVLLCQTQTDCQNESCELSFWRCHFEGLTNFQILSYTRKSRFL